MRPATGFYLRLPERSARCPADDLAGSSVDDLDDRIVLRIAIRLSFARSEIHTPGPISLQPARVAPQTRVIQD